MVAKDKQSQKVKAVRYIKEPRPDYPGLPQKRGYEKRIRINTPSIAGRCKQCHGFGLDPDGYCIYCDYPAPLVWD